jgi:integrase
MIYWTSYKNRVTVPPMSRNLNIPDSKRTTCLKLWCSACRREIGTNNFCKEINGPTSKCPNSKKSHQYKAVVYEPGSTKRRVLIIKERNIDKAIKAAVLFKEKVKSGHFEKGVKSINTSISPVAQISQPAGIKFMEAASYFLAALAGKRGAAHEVRVRSKHHVNNNESDILMFGKALKKEKVDIKQLDVTAITKEHVGYYHNYLLNDKGYSGKTYNRCMANLKGMYSYLNKYENMDLKNPFLTVQRRHTETDIKTIEGHEFKKLLEVVTEENGWDDSMANGKRRQRYHDFLVISFKLGLLTGLRREQLVNCRFIDIQEDQNGQPIVIATANLKVNRITNAEQTGKIRITPTAISPQLKALLKEMEYEKYKGTDRFLIAPDSTSDRLTIMDQISKGFHHYWKKLGIEKDIGFAHLRKTYCTRLQIVLGDNAKLLTGHSNQQTLNNFYINRTEIAKVASDKNIFPELDAVDNAKEVEIKKVRTEKKQKDRSLER